MASHTALRCHYIRSVTQSIRRVSVLSIGGLTMTKYEWITTASLNSLAGFFQSIGCDICSIKENCPSGRDMDCFDASYNWLRSEHFDGRADDDSCGTN
jgi:hypothetical protein